MLFKPRQRNCSLLKSLQIDGQTIDWVQQTSFLWVILQTSGLGLCYLAPIIAQTIGIIISPNTFYPRNLFSGFTIHLFILAYFTATQFQLIKQLKSAHSFADTYFLPRPTLLDFSKQTFNYRNILVNMSSSLSGVCGRTVNTSNSGSGVQASPVALFPQTRNFTPLCLSSPRCINGYRRHTAGG